MTAGTVGSRVTTVVVEPLTVGVLEGEAEALRLLLPELLAEAPMVTEGVGGADTVVLADTVVEGVPEGVPLPLLVEEGEPLCVGLGEGEPLSDAEAAEYAPDPQRHGYSGYSGRPPGRSVQIRIHVAFLLEPADHVVGRLRVLSGPGHRAGDKGPSPAGCWLQAAWEIALASR